MNSESTGQQSSPPAPVPPQLPPPSGVVYARPPKSPGLALLLSFFPGAGQIYNAQPAKALLFFFGFFGSIYGAAEIDWFPYAFLIPFVFIYGLIDSWRVAAQINARAAGGLVEEEEEEGFESPAWGAGLVLVGTLMLLNNLGWIDLAAFRQYWPVILIVAGGWFIYNSMRKRNGNGESLESDDAPEA